MTLPVLANDNWLSLFLILTGPFMGSFISASALDWPRRSNLGASRSSCAQCGRALGLLDLIPLLSFFILHGRCKNCGTPINRQHIVAELASTLIALSAVYVFHGWMMLVSATLGAVLLFIALVDYRTKLIPNGASYFIITSGGVVFYLTHGNAGLLSAIIGAAFGYGIFWSVAFTYRMLRGHEGLGLGDAKLLAGGGAWMSVFALPWIILMAASAALAVLIVGSKGKSLRRDTQIPFGPALALSIYVLWLWSGFTGTNFALL